MKILKQREGHPEGYYDAEIGGRRFSVVDFGKTMATHPYPIGLFMGWEAFPLDTKGELVTDYDPIRADSWEELAEKLS